MNGDLELHLTLYILPELANIETFLRKYLHHQCICLPWTFKNYSCQMDVSYGYNTENFNTIVSILSSLSHFYSYSLQTQTNIPPLMFYFNEIYHHAITNLGAIFNPCIIPHTQTSMMFCQFLLIDSLKFLTAGSSKASKLTLFAVASTSLLPSNFLFLSLSTVMLFIKWGSDLFSHFPAQGFHEFPLQLRKNSNFLTWLIRQKLEILKWVQTKRQ